MTDEIKGVTIAPLTTPTYASCIIEMKALLRAQGLWKWTQVTSWQYWELSLSRRKMRSRPSSAKRWNYSIFP